ncbi:hypothetical protein CD131_04665 [Staphylococcus muscae]|nr:hypothetical protein CD131_04665 [Staphylococcus muscae]
MLKKYFNTPKMPLSFYYTPYTVIYFFHFLIMLLSGAHGVISWTFNIIVFILGSYTYAWLSEYMLTTSNNFFIRYLFTKSMIFRGDFREYVSNVYSANSKHRVYNITNSRISEAHEVYVKRTFISIGVNVIIKFLLALIASPLFMISIFTHPIIMKKFYLLIDKMNAVNNSY